MGVSEQLIIDGGGAAYPIHVYENFELLTQIFHDEGLTGRRVCLIMDTNSAKLFGGEVEMICASFSENVTTFVAGDGVAGLDAAAEIYGIFVQHKLNKKSVVVGLGGRSVLNLAGYAAATFMCGLSFVQIPTTLKAQLEVAASGRFSISFNGRRGLIGTKHSPVFVYINITCLTTLSTQHFADGIAEAVKISLACDQGYLSFLTQNKESIKSLDARALAGVILGSCRVRAGMILKDGCESGGSVLDFGMLVSTAILEESEYTVSSGHALSIGCIASLRISLRRDYISHEDYALVSDLFKFFGFEEPLCGMSQEAVYERVKADAEAEAPSFVLMYRMGQACYEAMPGRDEVITALFGLVCLCNTED